MKKYGLIYFDISVLIHCSSVFLSKMDAIYTEEENHANIFYGNVPIKRFSDIDKNTFYFVVDELKYPFARRKLADLGLIEGKNFMRLSDWYGNDDLPSAFEMHPWEFHENGIDYTEPKLNIRSAIAASYISKTAKSVLDLGAGSEAMKISISPFTDYIPVDHVKRTDNTLVCDFNKNEFPSGSYDTVIAVGILTYIKDYKWFLNECMAVCENRIILSYEPIELRSSPDIRHKLGFLNNLCIGEIVSMFSENGFCFKYESILNNDIVLVFDKK